MELSKLVGKLLFVKSHIKLEDYSKGGIYVIKSTKSNNVYVGKTYKSFIGRFLGHQYGIIKGICHNKHFMRAVHKYGFETFELYIIDFLPEDLQKIAWKIKNHKKYELEHPGEYKKVNNWLNEKEIYWIAYYRKVANVYNQNDGGGGGLNPDKEVRERAGKHISISMKEYYATTPEAHERLSRQSKSYMAIPENRQHASDKAIERFKRPGEREKASIISKKRFEDPNEHAKISNGLKLYYQTDPNAIEVNRQSSIEMWKVPTKRKNIITGMKNRFKKSGALEKHGEQTKNNWKNENYRNKVIASINDPEVKKRKGKHISETKTMLGKLQKLRMKSLLEMLFILNPKFETLSIASKWVLFYDVLSLIEKHKFTQFTIKEANILLETYSDILQYCRYRYPKAYSKRKTQNA